MTKEKLDKQLTGQTSTSPFMSVRDGTERRVSFNTRDELGDKIDKLTVVMSKLAAKDSHERKPSKSQICKSRGQNRSYGQGSYQNRSDSRNRGHFMDTTVQGRIIEVKILEEMLEGTVDRIIEESTETVEIGTGQEKDHSQKITVTAVIGAQAIIDQDQGPEQIQIGIG